MTPRFNLVQRFSVLAFACVVAVAAVLGHAFATMLAERLLHREAQVSMEFLQSILQTDASAQYFTKAEPAAVPAPLQDSFRQISTMPDVLRTNVYSRERRVLWSSDQAMVGRRFGPNEELDRALAGELAYESGTATKEEHVAPGAHIKEGSEGKFIEIYVPVEHGTEIVGAIELYKTPDALFAAIRDAHRAVYLGSAVGGLVLYLALIGIVRRADAVMRDQQRRLVEGERLAVVGEMASAVAHSIRNPLAAIRTSVEDALDRDPGRFAEPGEDIVAEVDKVEAWVRQLLEFARPGSVRREGVDLNGLVRQALAGVERDTARRGVRVETALAEPPPPALGDAAVVEQVLQSIIGNALDAMPAGGTLAVSTAAAPGGGQIVVRDTGTGIAADQLEHVFKPFFTTKPRGVGLGLPLSRRLVERMGGSLTLESRPGAGTSVRIALPSTP